jgi:hypothetical protein
MQTVRIYRLKNIDRRTQARLKAAQLEAARVWLYCLERHQGARAERTGWPDRDDLQRETKGGQFACTANRSNWSASSFSPMSKPSSNFARATHATAFPTAPRSTARCPGPPRRSADMAST